MSKGLRLEKRFPLPESPRNDSAVMGTPCQMYNSHRPRALVREEVEQLRYLPADQFHKTASFRNQTGAKRFFQPKAALKNFPPRSGLHNLRLPCPVPPFRSSAEQYGRPKNMLSTR